MRAAVLRNTGDDKLEIVDDVELGPVGPGEVKVKIHATGVCHSDVSGMNGTIPQPAPFVPGHEGAGVVSEVGEGVTNVQPGDHVIIAWSAPCGSCKFCVDRKQPNLCINVQMAAFGAMHFSQAGTPIFGFAGSGTWAEEMIMPQQGVVKIDPETPHEIASLVGCGVMTGVGAALNTAKVTPGLVGRRVRLRRRRHLGHPGRPGRRCLRDRRRRPRRLEARGRPALRGHPRGQARRPRLGQGVDHRRRRLRLRLRGHRPAPDHAGRLRRHPPRRHHLRHRRGRHGQEGRVQRLRAVLRREDASRARTTARPTCAATSTGCSTCGSTAASTSRA